MITFYPEGTTVLPGDGELRTLHKIAASATTGSAALFSHGAVDPTAAPAAPSLVHGYLNTTTSVFFLWNPVTLSWD